MYIYLIKLLTDTTRHSNNLIKIPKTLNNLNRYAGILPCNFFLYLDSNNNVLINDDPENLKHHMKSHQIYQCNSCEFCTVVERNLKKHEQTEHSGVMYRCSNCSFISPSPGGIREHASSIHTLNFNPCIICLYLAQGPTALR